MALVLPLPRSRAGGAAADLDALLPAPGQGFLLPFLVAALRPDARAWLGAERLGGMARLLRLKDRALGRMLDAPPVPPEPLREPGPWTGRRVPMLRGRGGAVGWIEILWRPDIRTQGAGLRPPRPEDGSFAVRLDLPGAGEVEIRGRREGQRLDVVAEVERPLPRRVSAEMAECFDLALARLGLEGSLSVRSGREKFRT